ncbi:MAG: hypothetical protein Q9160_003854 [Pyrenula sp. 1 TL-2023]
MTMERPLEGKIPFSVPGAGKACETWYKVIGNLGKLRITLQPSPSLTPKTLISTDSDSTPLIAAHGGPGAGHEYLLPLSDLHTKYAIPVIFYDQLGCGKSTRLPEKAGDEAFWTVQLFISELENLVDYFGLRRRQHGFDFLGQSWGGMLGGAYAAQQPVGLRRLILADAPSSVPLFLEGVKALVKKLPKEACEAIEEGERMGDFGGEKYKEGCLVFYRRHVCRVEPWPEELVTAFGHLEEDTTVYLTM